MEVADCRWLFASPSIRIAFTIPRKSIDAVLIEKPHCSMPK